MVLTFESVDEVRKCDHSVKSYWAASSCGTVYYDVLKVVLFIMLYKVVLTFQSANKISNCDHLLRCLFFNVLQTERKLISWVFYRLGYDGYFRHFKATRHMHLLNWCLIQNFVRNKMQVFKLKPNDFQLFTQGYHSGQNSLFAYFSTLVILAFWQDIV